ncbi:hypothetical protein [Nonlabens xiamenensis]|uniref:hypothetical protein n=1 Tax=Nonlabens xiamenensis TaxID=2341043 RepID=UPI000F60B4E4|nr:hypothetical protein [Nonlabens xiamenensis]
MLEKKPSQDFHFEFQHRWGGVPSAVQQFEDWSKKQKGIFRFILLNFCLPWYAKWWLEFKVDKTMHDADQQIENLVDQWNEEEKKQTIVERTPSEVAGLDNLRITSWPPPDQWYTGPLEVFETSQIPSQKTQEIAEYPDPWEEAT